MTQPFQFIKIKRKVLQPPIAIFISLLALFETSAIQKNLRTSEDELNNLTRNNQSRYQSAGGTT